MKEKILCIGMVCVALLGIAVSIAINGPVAIDGAVDSVAACYAIGH